MIKINGDPAENDIEDPFETLDDEELDAHETEHDCDE